MRVLITWGTKRRGTEGIAKIIADTLVQQGYAATLAPAAKVRDLHTYDAVVIGGALYANRWQRDARRFVARHVRALRGLPVWCFSSGPLDDSAGEREIPPCPEVAVLMDRIGARGHITFGGRLEPEARGFPASAMAKKRSGDFRDPKRIRTWATHLARVLPGARPGVAVEPPARSLTRLAAHGVAGWALCAVLLLLTLPLRATPLAAALPSLAATAVCIGVARHYFRARGAREPVPTAFAFTAIFAALDTTLIAWLLMRSAELFTNLTRFWLPLALIFLTTSITGSIIAMLPRDRSRSRSPGVHAHSP
jgi:menaquinone-dependent protoporphyrinogen oxidase